MVLTSFKYFARIKQVAVDFCFLLDNLVDLGPVFWSSGSLIVYNFAGKYMEALEGIRI